MQVDDNVEAVIAPVCEDVRLCLVDEMSALRALAQRITWMMSSNRPSSTQLQSEVLPGPPPPPRFSADLLSDVAMSRLLFKLADARMLTNTRLDLSCESMSTSLTHGDSDAVDVMLCSIP